MLVALAAAEVAIKSIKSIRQAVKWSYMILCWSS